MTTVKGYGENRKFTVLTEEGSNHDIITGKKSQICNDDGEIIPVNTTCEDGCNREIYAGSTFEQNIQVI